MPAFMAVPRSNGDGAPDADRVREDAAYSGPAARRQAMVAPGARGGHVAAVTLALYIHWPFCLAKCPYCDFNSHVRDTIPQARFAAALRRELAWEAARLGPRRLSSIFFGGGTPSLMAPETVADLIADARALFIPEDNLEITLEANPTSVELAKLSAFRQAGVNRLSLGVQALDDAALGQLGRRHDAGQAMAALEHARAVFPRLSFDLIYARPGQSLEAWRAELRRALALAADHLSLYQLTIEPGTAFEALHRRGEIVLPDEDLATALYDATAEEAARHGLLPYEISNYAVPGAESRHNLAYWRYADYAGIGPGAHGRVTVGRALLATRRHRAPEPWADRVERDGHGSTAEEIVPPRDRAREALLMGLRLAEGVDLAWFTARSGMTLGEAVDGGILAACVEEGCLVATAARLTATAGRRRLDALLPRLVI
jgi:oxygen-independent coproporphyrinogen-3 oxidase